MARILFANFPADGHVNPMVPIVRRLIARGHEVLWYTGERFRPKVEKVGATYLPLDSARDYSLLDPVKDLPAERRGLTGIECLQWDMRHMFIDSGVRQHHDLRAIYDAHEIDLVVSETIFFGATVLAPENAPPAVSIGIFPLGVESKDTAPFGPGMAPSSRLLGRVRNRFLNWAAQRFVFQGVDRYLNEQRVSLSLPPLEKFFFNAALDRYRLYLQATVPMFEYPRSDLPDKVRFIGPLLPEGGRDFEPPEWWPELSDERKVVLVTQGTVAIDTTQLIEPTLAALAGRKDLFVIATAPRWEPDPAAVPSNARVEAFVPYAALFPHVDLLITNGGYGGVQFALSHGVPVLVVGASEEKLEIAARVDWSGVGLSIRSVRATPKQIADGVTKVLGDSTYRAKAGAFAAEAKKHDAPETAADELEALIQSF